MEIFRDSQPAKFGQVGRKEVVHPIKTVRLVQSNHATLVGSPNACPCSLGWLGTRRRANAASGVCAQSVSSFSLLEAGAAACALFFLSRKRRAAVGPTAMEHSAARLAGRLMTFQELRKLNVRKLPRCIYAAGSRRGVRASRQSVQSKSSRREGPPVRVTSGATWPAWPLLRAGSKDAVARCTDRMDAPRRAAGDVGPVGQACQAVGLTQGERKGAGATAAVHCVRERRRAVQL